MNKKMFLGMSIPSDFAHLPVIANIKSLSERECLCQM